MALGTVLILGGLATAAFFLFFREPRVLTAPPKKRFIMKGVTCFDAQTGSAVSLKQCDPKDVAKILEV